MEYITLGKTKLVISRIGFGGWGISGGAKDEQFKGIWEANDKDSSKALRLAYEEGVNFYDTALYYGNGHSEKLIADTLKNKKIVLATKVPPLDHHWPAVNKDIRCVFPEEYIINMAMESYFNLGKKTIDILQLHVWNDAWFDSDEWRSAFAYLKKNKIANYFGISLNEHSPKSALRIVDSGQIDTIQSVYNIFDQSPRDKLFPLAAKRGVGIIARVPLDEGSLSGTLNNKTIFNDWRKFYFTGSRLNQTVKRVDFIKSKMVNQDRTMSQVALRFCLEKPGADVAIVGMSNPSHVKENCASVDLKFSEKELNFLKKQRWLRNFYPPL